MNDSLKFKIVGENKMNCSGCERSVKNILTLVDGVEKVDASHETQLVSVTIRPDGPSAATLLQELAGIDYEAIAVS
jgi:copper chaperone CopZ